MLKILRQIVDEVENSDSLRSALQKVVSLLRDALETDASAIFLLNEENQFLLRAADGFNQELIDHLIIPSHLGLLGLVAERKEPVNIENAPLHPRYYMVADSSEENYQAFLGVPILHSRRLLGVLIVEQELPRKYDAAEEAFLLTVASQLAELIVQREHTAQGEHGYVPEVLRGLPGSSGVAIGKVVVVYPKADLEAVPDQETDNIVQEILLFEQAIESARHEVQLLSDRFSDHLPPEEHLLFDAYLAILDTEGLQRDVVVRIQQENMKAETALKYAIREYVKEFKALDDEYLRERVSDIEDLGRRILVNLQNEEMDSVDYPENTILIGAEISAAQLAEVPQGRLVGVVCGEGSSNSHVAILARALGVATVMGVGEMPLYRLQGLEAVVDGYLGQVYLSPSQSLLEEFKQLTAEEEQLDSELDELRDQPAQTADGHRVLLYVNTGLMADVSRSMTTGAEGIGLYRTEVPFLTRDRFPSAEEQRIIYRQLLNVFAPRPVVMRVLDIGGDKPLPYFPIEDDNPFLGWRGIRVLLEHPEIFLSQIRAMLRANEGLDNLHIMLPLITDLSEVDEATRLIKVAYQELRKEGLEIKMPPIGIMVEVPSAVYQSYLLAQRVDFLSVGSNDLTQYILAVDRNNTRVANLYNSLHPAVLRALRQVVEGAHEAGKSVSICGEMASDPVCAVLLLGMGFDMLSVSAPVLPRIKWVIQRFSMNKARKLLNEAMNMHSAAEIRRHLEFALEEAGLGGLIRAGRY